MLLSHYAIDGRMIGVRQLIQLPIEMCRSLTWAETRLLPSGVNPSPYSYKQKGRKKKKTRLVCFTALVLFENFLKLWPIMVYLLGMKIRSFFLILLLLCAGESLQHLYCIYSLGDWGRQERTLLDKT